jgi:hypothetical protein
MVPAAMAVLESRISRISESALTNSREPSRA